MTASSTNSTAAAGSGTGATIRVLDIVCGTSVDGPGLRTSIYCAGCENRCEGCHNPQSWDPCAGEEMTVEELFDRIAEADMNVTFTGGDPMLHPEGFSRLARLIKERTEKTIWCYTGYRFEQVMQSARRRELALLCDVVVDGPFLLAERDLSLHFRGSRNQRIIDVGRSLHGEVVTIDD